MAVTINADNGVSSGSAGLKQTADSTGVLALQTNGTTAVTVDTSQNVGIGTSSPAYKLDVSATSFIAASVSTSYSGAGNIRIADASTTSGSAPYIGSVGNNLTFGRIGTAEYMRIDSSGNVGIGTSSPSTRLHVSGGGVSFQGSGYPSSGAGLEFQYNAPTGTIGAYDRTGSAYKDFRLFGSTIQFEISGNEKARIDSSGNLLVNTTTAQTGAKLAVTGGIQGTIQSGTAVNSTSGTSISFTSIPSWVKRITVMLNGVSTNGTSFLIIQLGTGATPTYTTSGYVSGSVNTTATTGMLIWGGSAADIRVGSCVLTNFGNNIWNSMAAGGYANGAGGANAGGYVSLGATLTAVRVTTINGTDTFDAGSINILYEG